MAREPVCPSTTGDADGARIIGFINRDGSVAPFATPIALTDAMRQSIDDKPEKVFRLAGPCLGAGCRQWSGTECRLIARMRAEIEPQLPAPALADRLPECGIRPGCVWWRQDGPAACRVCPHVIYNPSP